MKTRRSFSFRAVSRPGMAAFSARYSRFVGLMKVVLPVTAAVLAVMVAVWPYVGGSDNGIPLSYAAIGVDIDDAVYMTNARYLGTDDQNQPYTITADQVTQETDDSDVIRLVSPKADILLDDGVWLALTARSGTLRRASEKLLLDGGVSIFTDAGYELRTERAEIDLRANRAHGTTRIEGQGPFGMLSADGFRLEDKGRRIHFEGRVRVVVYPKAGSERL